MSNISTEDTSSDEQAPAPNTVFARGWLSEVIELLFFIFALV
jgi:hypothetical protein